MVVTDGHGMWCIGLSMSTQTRIRGDTAVIIIVVYAYKVSYHSCLYRIDEYIIRWCWSNEHLTLVLVLSVRYRTSIGVLSILLI